MSKSNQVWTVLSMLEWATEYFEGKKVPSPRLSIEWILADVLNIKRLDIYLQYDRPLSDGELDQIRPLVKRRAAHEPLQYITGFADFMGGRFKVTPDVLIPRTETEQLVELVTHHFSDKASSPLNLLDIGTGSGCIPIAVKQINPGWHCAGLDVSEAALEVAKENAGINEVEVEFFKADLQNLNESAEVISREWDIVISNPPYITPAEKKEMEAEVLEYEPQQALFHDNPVDLYEKIAAFAAHQQSALFLEINNKFSEEIKKTVSQFFGDVKLVKDLDENDRFVIATAPF